jgi:hypothetical protein
MALNAKNKPSNGGGNKVDQPVMEAGTYPARLVQVLDLGVQEQRPYKGEVKRPVQELMVTYEFVDEFIIDEEGNPVEDKPRWVSETFPFYSLDSDLAKSTKRYYALDAKGEYGGDWPQLLGSPVMVTINVTESKGKQYNNVVSTAAMREKEAAKLPELQNEGKVLDLSDAGTSNIFLTLPKWIQDKIREGEEWEGCAVQRAVDGGGKKAEKKEPAAKKEEKKGPEEDMDDDIPFETGDEEEAW